VKCKTLQTFGPITNHLLQRYLILERILWLWYIPISNLCISSSHS